MRIIEARFPRQRRRAEAHHIGIHITDLLGVAIRASFAAINFPARVARWRSSPRGCSGDILRVCSSSTRPGHTPSNKTDIAKKPTPATLATI